MIVEGELNESSEFRSAREASIDPVQVVPPGARYVPGQDK